MRINRWFILLVAAVLVGGCQTASRGNIITWTVQPDVPMAFPLVEGEIFVAGDVDRPGVYALTDEQGTTFRQAFCGATDSPHVDHVVLIRPIGDRAAARVLLDVPAIFTEEQPDFCLRAGDILVFSRRRGGPERLADELVRTVVAAAASERLLAEAGQQNVNYQRQLLRALCSDAMAAAQLQALRVQSDPAAVEVHHIILDRIAAFTGQVEMAGLPSGVSLTFLTPPDGARGGR